MRHRVTEAAEYIVFKRRSVRDRGLGGDWRKDRIEAFEKCEHPLPETIEARPVLRETIDPRAVRLQLLEPPIEQRMGSYAADFTQVTAQGVAAIRANHFHLEVVALFNALGTAFLD